MIRALSFIGWFIIGALNRTLRVSEINADAATGRLPGGNILFSFWHGEQFIPFFRHRGQGIAIMSSLSRDGEIQSGILRLFGYSVVRGSSSRGAERALVETIRLVRNGGSAAFAVDGPRGPVYRSKPGIIYLAQKTGCSIVPVSSAAKARAVLARAWDRYEVPLPFSRAVIAYGAPIRVAKGDPVERKAKELDEALDRLSRFTHRGFWSDSITEYLDRHPRPKILIVQPSRIGDVIFSLPTLAAIRRRYPHAWIGWFVDERCAPVLEGCPDIDEVIVFDRRKKSPAYVRRLARELRAKHIDLSIDLHGLFKSAFMVMLAGARYRLASASTRGMKELSWLFSHEIRPASEDMHCVERHLAVARFLGCDAAAPRYPIAVGEPDRQKAAELLRRSGVSDEKPLVVTHPGGGWTSRRWSPERFAQLADRLAAEAGAQVVLIGGKEGGAGEKGLNEEVRGRASSKIIDLTGALNLKELAALLLRARLYVGNEAGPLHLAAALDVPAIALLGPTDPKRTGPYGGKVRVIRHTLDCQPCRQRSCPSRRCMELISVDEVFAAAREML